MGVGLGAKLRWRRGWLEWGLWRMLVVDEGFGGVIDGVMTRFRLVALTC